MQMKKKLACLCALLLGISFVACNAAESSGSSSVESVSQSSSVSSSSLENSSSSSKKDSSSSSSSSVEKDTYPVVGTKTVTVPYTTAVPTIDGTMDTIYEEQGVCIKLEEPNLNNGEWIESLYFEYAEMYLLYDDSYIYIYAEVGDFLLDTTNEKVWERDALALIFDYNYYREKNAYSNNDALKENIGYINLAADAQTEADVEYYHAFVGMEEEIEWKTDYYGNLIYTYELRVSILPNFEGNQIGFEPWCIEVYNGERKSAITWNEDGSQMWQYTHVAGTLIFGEKTE